MGQPLGGERGRPDDVREHGPNLVQVLRSLECMVLRAGHAQPLQVPGIELPGVPGGPPAAEMTLGAIDRPQQFPNDLLIGGRQRAAAGQLLEDPWVTQRAARYARKFYPWYLERLGVTGTDADAFQRTDDLDQARAMLTEAVRGPALAA